MSISRAKNLRRDLCRVLGHTLSDLQHRHDPSNMSYSFCMKCSRCMKKSGEAKVKYIDMLYNLKGVLQRAKDRIEQSMQDR